MSIFSERLKKLRVEKKLTHQELANKVSVNRVTYTNWENGKRSPELDKVVELARELDSTLDYLSGNTDFNALSLTPDDLKKMNHDEIKQLQKELEKNINSIFSIGKEKFGVSDEQMNEIKKDILSDFLKKDNKPE